MFLYFGYGSNMALGSLRAKGVEPLESRRADLRGWRLRFNVRHFFRHEGGVANIEPTGVPGDHVQGVLHLCRDEHLALLDAAEAYGHGYDRIEVAVRSADGERRALAYVGMPAFLDEACLPSRRYLNILLRGAEEGGLDAGYRLALQRQPVHSQPSVGPYVPPPGDHPGFTAETLARHLLHTALAGWVFDMSGARPQHEFLKSYFGGRDMTLFHLQRHDQSDGRETLDDVRHGRYTEAQRRYLDEYLHEYAREYRFAGRFLHD